MDEIDRDQEFNERQLENMIARSRTSTSGSASLYFCRKCGEALPENDDYCYRECRCVSSARRSTSVKIASDTSL